MLLNKNVILFLFLALLLIGGYFVFKKERGLELKLVEQTLEEVQNKINLAENFLILKKEGEANKLLQEAWQKCSPLTKNQTSFTKQALTLKNSIEEKLASLNKLEVVSEPQLLFKFEKMNFFPKKIIVFKEPADLYFFNPVSPIIFSLKTKQIFEASGNLKLATAFSDVILFFSSPDILIRYLPETGFEEQQISPLYSGFNLNDLVSFKSSLYFLDSRTGEIAKYSPPFQKAEAWLNPQTKKAINAKSLAIDGSIWVLTKENKIEKYSGGIHQKTLESDFFPQPENLSKIWTSFSHSYLYLLEPSKNRLVILTKQGQIVKQYQSEKFDNLLDFAVSADAKTIWLLNGSKVYQIKF